MIKRHRDLLRIVVADLRHTLSGGPGPANSGAGGQRGELERLATEFAQQTVVIIE